MNILLFAMSRADMINWTLAIIAVIAICLAAVALFTLGGSYLTPRIERVQKGMKAQPGEKPCCPPGVGCNDPSEAHKACRRQIAMENGDADDLRIMEGAWSQYHRLPKTRTRARRSALHTFSDMRDKIFYAKFAKDLAENPGNRLPALEAMKGEEEVDAEIVSEKS